MYMYLAVLPISKFKIGKTYLKHLLKKDELKCKFFRYYPIKDLNKVLLVLNTEIQRSSILVFLVFHRNS